LPTAGCADVGGATTIAQEKIDRRCARSLASDPPESRQASSVKASLDLSDRPARQARGMTANGMSLALIVVRAVPAGRLSVVPRNPTDRHDRILRSPIMAAITINDLPLTRDMSRRSMSLIRGAGAPWVFGWIQPYAPPVASVGPVVNLYQTNNTFYANQIVNQFQLVDVNNAGANANLTVVAGQNGKNGLG
jgi:hypothetical protein